MKKNNESVSKEEEEAIATLISLNRLEERGIGTE